MKVGLGLPFLGDLAGEVVGPMMGLVLEMARFVDKGQIQLITLKDYCPHDRARENIMDTAIMLDCDYLLFVDADMIVPDMAFGTLFWDFLEVRRTTPNVVVMSGLYLMRGYPFMPVWSVKGPDGKLCYAEPGTDKFTEVVATGMGFALIDVKWVKEKLKKPRFLISHKLGEDGIERTTWEDGWFCAKIHQAGGKVLGNGAVKLGHCHTRMIITTENADALRREHLLVRGAV